MSLRVEASYGHATVQGPARTGFRAFGVPPGGVWDPSVQDSLNLGLGNSPDAFVLELALCRLTLSAREEVVLAWDGADVAVSVNGAPGQGTPITLCAGDVLEIEPPRAGARVWIAIRGGFMHVGDAPLKRGDVLRRGTAQNQATGEGKSHGLVDANSLRTIPGRAEFMHLFENVYQVRHDSNRVGIRLDGPKMKHQLELPSEPATPGVIQITPDGLPIILGPDGPTIGGYPRGGVVATVEFPKLAQLRPGDSVRFLAIDLELARAFIRSSNGA